MATHQPPASAAEKRTRRSVSSKIRDSEHLYIDIHTDTR